MISKISTFYASNKNDKAKPAANKHHMSVVGKTLSFKSHPDYKKLKEEYELLASNYFRRGQFYGSPSKAFEDVVEALKLLFKNEGKKNALFVGLAESQEPFSLLAQIKSIIKNKQLKDTLDLSCIDLQPPISQNRLFKQSFYDSYGTPAYARDSFVVDMENCGKYDFMHYRVKDDIYEFLNDTYQNTGKTKWDTPVQDVINNYPDNTFDLISINNTLGYIRDEEQRKLVHKNLERITNNKGIVITDPYRKFTYDDKYAPFSKFKKLFEGIWQKTE